jgi:hypothetical protein
VRVHIWTTGLKYEAHSAPVLPGQSRRRFHLSGVTRLVYHDGPRVYTGAAAA